MLRTINYLTGFPIIASDGEIGEVEEFYFDDETWTIRYLVVKTGSWLSGRKVLISPEALVKDSTETGMFPVHLTMEQVRRSPDIDTDKPVSRQQEAELAKYYPWQSYWGSGFYPGGVWGVIAPVPTMTPASIAAQEKKHEVDVDIATHQDVHLRSTHQVTGYHVHALDGDIGHINDFIIDNQTWQVTSLVVDTHNWMGGRKVLLEVRHIKEIQWDISKITVDITVEAVKNSSVFKESEYKK